MPSHPSRHRTRSSRRPPAPPAWNDAEVALDLLRADLYRMLDEIARAQGEAHHALVLQFERAWERFKNATLTAR